MGILGWLCVRALMCMCACLCMRVVVNVYVRACV